MVNWKTGVLNEKCVPLIEYYRATAQLKNQASVKISFIFFFFFWKLFW